MKRLIQICLAVVALATSTPALAYNPHPFDVTVSLSQDARARLHATSENIIVWATYYGAPSQAGLPHVDEAGRIALGSERVELVGEPGVARFTRDGISGENAAWIDGDIQVNINVFSARLSGPDNILDCDFFEGKRENLVRHPVTLHCSLIVENVETKFKS